MKKLLWPIVLACALTICAALPSPVSSLELARTSAPMPELSETAFVMEVTAEKQLYINHVTSSVTVEWRTSDRNVVRVGNGLVSPISQGSATVTAIINGMPQSCDVTVVNEKLVLTDNSSGMAGAAITRGGMPESTEYVWRTKSGSKYHSTNDCGTTDTSRAILITKDEAIRLGLEPCSKCYGSQP